MIDVAQHIHSASAGLPERYELIDGALVKKASPSGLHAGMQLWFGHVLSPFWGERGQGRPGGWWFASEAEIEIAPGQKYLPDVAGWRLERVGLASLGERPIQIVPNWVCEILSPSTSDRDLGTKQRNYHLAHVDHYWIVDPDQRTLAVLRRAKDGYTVVMSTGTEQPIQVEPFADVELDLDGLFAMLG